jgi:hypothetical protein
MRPDFKKILGDLVDVLSSTSITQLGEAHVHPLCRDETDMALPQSPMPMQMLASALRIRQLHFLSARF